MSEDRRHPSTPRWVIYSLLVMATMSWGGVFIVLRHINAIREQHNVTAWDVVWLRFIPAALLFLPVIWSRRAESMRVLRHAFWPVFWIGILTTSVYNFFLITGEERVPAAVASLTIALGPSMTFAMALIFLGEKATWTKLAGILISVAGLVHISLAHTDPDGAPLVPGYLAITILAPLVWSISTIVGKRMLTRHDPLVVTAVSVVLGTLTLLPVPFFHGNFMAVAGSLPPSFWLATMYLALLPTFFGYFVWYKALDHLDATNVSMFIFLVPVFGILFSTLGEPLSLAVITGGILILAGVVLTNYRRENRNS